MSLFPTGVREPCPSQTAAPSSLRRCSALALRGARSYRCVPQLVLQRTPAHWAGHCATVQTTGSASCIANRGLQIPCGDNQTTWCLLSHHSRVTYHILLPFRDPVHKHTCFRLLPISTRSRGSNFRGCRGTVPKTRASPCSHVDALSARPHETGLHTWVGRRHGMDVALEHG